MKNLIVRGRSTSVIIKLMIPPTVLAVSLTGLLCLTPNVGHCDDRFRAAIKSDSPIAWWSLNESSHAVARSEVGEFDANYTAGVSTRRGVCELAAGFAATSGRVESTLDADQDQRIEEVFNGSFSIEIWLLDEAAAADNKTNYSIFYKADQRQFISNSLWLYRTRQTGAYTFRIQGSKNESVQISIPNPAGSKAAGDRKWHHVVITIDRGESSRVVAWIDAREVGRTAIDGQVRIDNDGPLIIGNNHHRSSPWHGAIDELAIYDKALNPDTIRTHFLMGQLSLQKPTPVQPPQVVANTEEFFELKIRPLLIEKCSDCHTGNADAESALAFGSRSALLIGGDFGPAIIPGRSADSLLIHTVRRTHKELSMPPDRDDTLSKQEIEDLARWIDAGAVWGKESTPTTDRIPIAEAIDLKTDHWSFQPRRIVDPPEVQQSRWSHSGIDQFVEARRQGAASTAHADRLTLIRRATFDLTGLPPNPNDVEAFLNDPADEVTAFARVVDRLLASSHYGQRQGRQWLDVARYADTQGDVGDYPIPTAYLYRNWVINSLSGDMPFDEFIQAQIAGDLVARNVEHSQQARQLIIATGFIAMSRRFGNRKEDDMYLTIEDTLDTVGRGVLGLTLRCARCHDHKFDPILNTDYYRLYGIFESTVYPWMGMSDEKSPSDLATVATDPESQKTAKQYWSLISRYEYQINNHFRPWLKPTLNEFKAVSDQLKTADAKKKEELQKRREALLDRHGGKFRELMLKGLQWIKSEKQQMAENPPLEFVFAVSDGKPHNARLHRRGNPKQPGDEVPRGFPQVFAPEPADIPNGSGRLELARWLTRPDHPLTARVIVNRIWQQHFGRGLVETADNFGYQGSLPTHPDLLDWLAEQFVRDDWSLKKLHRRIMLSETYRMASGTSDESPWLTAFPRRRLDAEEIRDSMLAISGQLDDSQGGAHPFKPWYTARYSLNGPFHEEFPTKRRSVYLLTQRLFRNSFFALFDGPDRNSSTSRRGSASVPSQALYLMNSPFIKEQSGALAKRLRHDETTDEGQLIRLYKLAFARAPSADEISSLKLFLNDYRSKSDDKHQAMVAVCRAVLTSNEFFFID